MSSARHVSRVQRPDFGTLNSERCFSGQKEGKDLCSAVKVAHLQLEPDLLILGMSKLHNLREARNVGIEPDARVLGGNAAPCLNGCGLHDEQARAARDDAAHMRGRVPRLLEAVQARVLTERRDEDAVLKSHPTDCKRGEQLGNGGSIGLRVDCSPCWGLLGRREERDALGRLDVRRGLAGALARRHDGFGDGHHDGSDWHRGSFLVENVQDGTEGCRSSICRVVVIVLPRYYV